VKIPINTIDEAGNVITTFYDVGVRLQVTPHVTSAGRVALAIYVERNSYQPTASGYSITTRWARTNVIIDDAGALIIGGMTTEDTKKKMRGVPVLKDIPVIGRLFRFESEEKTETELVIVVTPYIVVNGEEDAGHTQSSGKSN
jgi:type II secretory pathway component GspD/PulD (secretin)